MGIWLQASAAKVCTAIIATSDIQDGPVDGPVGMGPYVSGQKNKRIRPSKHTRLQMRATKVQRAQLGLVSEVEAEDEDDEEPAGGLARKQMEVSALRLVS